MPMGYIHALYLFAQSFTRNFIHCLNVVVVFFQNQVLFNPSIAYKRNFVSINAFITAITTTNSACKSAMHFWFALPAAFLSACVQTVDCIRNEWRWFFRWFTRSTHYHWTWLAICFPHKLNSHKGRMLPLESIILLFDDPSCIKVELRMECS